MRKITNLNTNWNFHQGELEHRPSLMSKKSYALGGFTAPLADEKGELVPISAGGEHFLKLIAQGNVRNGLRNLANTQLIDSLDSSWQKVDIPDDWKRRIPYQNNPANLMSGSKPDGVAYYRKSFNVDNFNDEDEYILHFDGVMRGADVWLNGAYLGHNNSGYTEFSFDITPLLRQENTLLVRTDTTTGAEGWWYEGAGIYKDVWLEERNPVHIVENSFFIETLKVKNEQAKIRLHFEVENNSAANIQVKPIFNLNEDIHFEFSESKLLANEKKSFVKDLVVNKVKLWSPEHPNLYQANIKIDNDSLTKQVGIRTVYYDTSGFILNGQHYELRGVCEHQDFGGVGVALNQDIIDYKIKSLKKMGINALRSSHHFASKELLNACDRLGIILINENRLLEATPWRLNDLSKMVKISRFHPSIVFWSIANEEIVGNTKFAERSAKKLTSIIRRLHPGTILISAELLNPEGIVNDNYLQYFDVLALNYPEAGVMGNGGELIHQSHPNLPMMSTENASYFSTRGIYRDNGDKDQCNNLGSMYSMVLPGKRKPGDPGVGGTAHPERVMSYLKEHSYMGGVFLWTGFDYYGEPSPFAWPAISSQFGISDLGGLPKDYYYYYQAHWVDDPVLYLATNWNKNDLDIVDNKVNVRVFSNLDEVELFLNGKSLGKKVVQDCECNWFVSYEAGHLLVKGYKNGKLVAEDERVSSGFTADVKTVLRYDGKTTAIFEVSAIDKDKQLVPDAENLLSVKATAGKVIGLTNGNPADISPFSVEKIRLFSGKAVVVVQKDAHKQADIKVRVEI